MRRRNDSLLYKVVLPGAGTGNTLAASALRTVGIGAGSLYVTKVGQRNGNFLFVNQIDRKSVV